MKAFRSIRRGVKETVGAIAAGTFGNDFKGSPVELIDVIWFKNGELACAFEVEHSTSIYSGILRMKDLARSVPGHDSHFYLVAPEAREKEVLAQMLRPAFQGEEEGFQLAYLPGGELRAQCDAICRFGADRSALLKLARGRDLPPA